MYLMLDFETLGSAGDTIAVSLGAVAFNREGVIGKKLFVFDMHDQIKLGRTFTASTLEWWMHPKRAEARKVFYAPTEPKLKVEQFFPVFEAFVDECLLKVGDKRDSLKPVGNGANFDVTILENLYRCCHPNHENAIIWKFWNVWCFRTLEHVFGLKKLCPRPHGTYHTADEDALYQANCMIALLNKQAKKKKAPAKADVSEEDF